MGSTVLAVVLREITAYSLENSQEKELEQLPGWGLPLTVALTVCQLCENS